MVTVWLKPEGREGNCGINRGFSCLVIGRGDLYDLETEREDKTRLLTHRCPVGQLG